MNLDSILPVVPPHRRDETVLRQICFLGQEHLLEHWDRATPAQRDAFLTFLRELDVCYAPIGGISGYHNKVLELLKAQNAPHYKSGILKIERLNPMIAEPKDIATAIAKLPSLGELYVVGGAGDRLDYRCKEGNALPQAALPFLGHSLLESLIRDVQGREALYERTFGKRLMTPIAMMCSFEKQNLEKVVALCEEARWFGRPKELFFFFVQPQVPVLREDGHWLLDDPLQHPLLIRSKPGGHGVVWKLAREKGILDWFQAHGCKKLLVRQINNPLACVDDGLLHFLGHGFCHDKAFGILSCERLVGAAEGMAVDVTRIVDGKTKKGLSNIEYSDFVKCGIADVPAQPHSRISAFPANTNILFADIAAVKEAVQTLPFPGLLVNFKAQDESGLRQGRLECTMQNIADALMSTEENPRRQSYIFYQPRYKTLSTCKSPYQVHKPIEGTPIGALADTMRCRNELLSLCQATFPEFSSVEAQLPYFFDYHPALGPSFADIAKKIRHLHLHRGAELRLELGNADIEGLDLQGSFLVTARHPLFASVVIKSVRIANKGPFSMDPMHFALGLPPRQEACMIHFEGRGELLVENALLSGSYSIAIPHKSRAFISSDGKVSFEPLHTHRIAAL